jgi:hypothetical protein
VAPSGTLAFVVSAASTGGVNAVLASMGLEPRACRTTETPLVGAELSPGEPASLAQRILRAAREEMAVTLDHVQQASVLRAGAA